jgi:hypothetical protein
MRRMLRIAAGVMVLMTGSFVLAQDAATTDLYPLKKDSKWEYKVGESKIVVHVASSDASGATLETLVNDKVVATETIQVKGDGVYRTKINKTDITPPVKILDLDMGKAKAAGTEWTIDSKIQDQAVKGKFTIKPSEKVKVPAKEYENVVVVDGPDFSIAETKTGVKYWFAPGVGIVKLAYSISGNDAVLELTNYTEGK